jgi:hypothetical protein
MELWSILLLSVFGFFLILGFVLVIKSKRAVPALPEDIILPPIETAVIQVENGYLDAIRCYMSDSSLEDEDDIPLEQVAQTLKRSYSVKYKNSMNIKKTESRDQSFKEYKVIDQLRNKRFNTLPTPPSTPMWKRPVSVIKSGSVSSMDSINGLDNLEEKQVQNIPICKNQLDRAQAVAFLKSKKEQRSLQTPPRGRLQGKKLERIPSNEI